MNGPIQWLLRRESLIALLPLFVFFGRGAAELTILTLCGLFLHHSHKSRDWAWLRRPWLIAAGVLWAYLLLVATPLAGEPDISRALFWWRWPLFGAALAYWLIPLTTVRQRFEWTLVLLVAFILPDSVYQYFNGTDILGNQVVGARPAGVRLTGPFENPHPGYYTLMIFFIALPALVLRRGANGTEAPRRTLLTTLALLTLGVGFIFLTGERMEFIMFVFGSGVIVLGAFVAFKSERKLLIVATLVLATLLAGAASTQKDTVKLTVVSFFDELGNFREKSGYGTLFYVGYQMWKDHPVFGVGPKNFRILCEEPPYRAQTWLCATHVHNIYLEWLVETGVIGFIGFTLMVLLIFREVIVNCRRGDQLFLLACALAVLFNTFWPILGSRSFFSNQSAMLMWMTIGWAMGVAHAAAQSAIANKGKEHDAP